MPFLFVPYLSPESFLFEGIVAAHAKGVRFGSPNKIPPENFASLVNQWEREEPSTTTHSITWRYLEGVFVCLDVFLCVLSIFIDIIFGIDYIY
jgi:hypothetical protein